MEKFKKILKANVQEMLTRTILRKFMAKVFLNFWNNLRKSNKCQENF